jgi:phosphoribosylaminoimidazole carboxylase (NCAIR synthetase)
MNKKEYQRLREQLREEYEKKLEALDTVWGMYGNAPIVNNAAPRPSGSGEWTHDISKRDAVRESIKTIIGENFNVHRVRLALNQVQPSISPEIEDNALSAIVSKLAEMEEIEVVKKKVGKSPAIYKNKG